MTETKATSTARPAEKDGDWQPIETAPKDGRRMLLCNELWSDTFGEVQIGYEQHGQWLFDSEMSVNDIEDEILDVAEGEEPMTIT